jgi:hypothetical protein
MPFGLCNAPSTFTALMNKVFAKYLDEFVVVYLDDILIYSRSVEQHVEHLRAVLTTLREQKLFAKLKKCEFAQSSIGYLGHVISKDGIATDPAKIAAVQEWPVPANVHDVRSFLGLCSYYRRFVPGFAQIAAPLTDLTRADVRDIPAAWGPQQQAAFEALKHSLTSAPLLRHADPSKPLVLRTDASDFAIGSVLMQEHAEQLHPVAYYSRKLSPSEAKYGAYAREMLAVIDSLRHFEHYVDGRQITVESDQQALSWFWSQRQLDKQQARWMAKLQAYDLQLKYIQGKLNLVADALSRRPDHRSAQLCLCLWPVPLCCRRCCRQLPLTPLTRLSCAQLAATTSQGTKLCRACCIRLIVRVAVALCCQRQRMPSSVLCCRSFTLCIVRVTRGSTKPCVRCQSTLRGKV